MFDLLVQWNYIIDVQCWVQFGDWLFDEEVVVVVDFQVYMYVVVQVDEFGYVVGEMVDVRFVGIVQVYLFGVD